MHQTSEPGGNKKPVTCRGGCPWLPRKLTRIAGRPRRVDPQIWDRPVSTFARRQSFKLQPPKYLRNSCCKKNNNSKKKALSASLGPSGGIRDNEGYLNEFTSDSAFSHAALRRKIQLKWSQDKISNTKKIWVTHKTAVRPHPP